MEQYKTFPCPCGNGDVLRLISESEKNPGRVYYACPTSKPKRSDWGCKYFRWEDLLRMCPCGHGYCTAEERKKRVSYKCPLDGDKNCGYKETVSKGAGTPGPFTPPAGNFLSGTPGPSSAGKGSGGLEADCPHCRLLLVKIKILEAKLDLARHNEDPSQSAALQELIAQLDGILLDES